MSRSITYIALVAFSAISLVSCYDPTQKADVDNLTKSTGVEYAPQMYHSKPYDPMSQVKNRSAGEAYFPWINVGGGISDYDTVAPHGEFYNSNYYNEYGMNMRTPAENSVPRGELPYRLTSEQIDLAENLVPALDINGNIYATSKSDSAKAPEFDLAEGEVLYQRFCSHCHGNGVMSKEGDYTPGKVGDKFGGVPAYNSPAKKDMTIGHVFHVITHGKNSMGAHASQLSQSERWKIASYVQTLQKK